jgi:hypothetical protein
MNSRMPISLAADSTGTRAFVTGGRGRRPEQIPPLTEHGEQHWFCLLIGEINREMRLGLDVNVSYARTLAAVRRTRDDVGPIAAVAIGASNAARTATAAEEEGGQSGQLG